MGAPRFFVGMFGTLSVVAVVMYLWTGSVFSTAVDVAVSAMLLQFGYILCILFLIFASAKRRRISVRGGARASRLAGKFPGLSKLL